MLSLSKTRLSISGWFHGDNIDRPVPYQEPRPKSLTPCALEVIKLFNSLLGNKLYSHAVDLSEAVHI